MATATEPKLEPAAVASRRPIAVTGAAGFVGTHVCRALSEAGWKVRGMVRNPEQAARRLANLNIEFAVGDLRDTGYLQEALSGCEAVIHLAAIAMERGGQSYEQINTKITIDLLDAAQAAGVTRFLHMSQNGSDSASPYAFLKSKGVAQDAVANSSLQWTIFRPSVIFGPEDEFVNVLARMARLTPVVFPVPGGGKATFQPIHVDDVAAAVRSALTQPDTIGGIYPLGGPAPLTLREMAQRIVMAMRIRRTLVGVPVWLIRPAIAVMQRIIPNPPVTTSLLDLLAINNSVPNNTIHTVFGITPTPFAPEELDYLQQITVKSAIRSFFR